MVLLLMFVVDAAVERIATNYQIFYISFWKNLQKSPNIRLQYNFWCANKSTFLQVRLFALSLPISGVIQKN